MEGDLLDITKFRWYIHPKGWASHRAKTYGEEKGKGRNAESFVQVWLREIEERSNVQRIEVMKGKRSLEPQVSSSNIISLAIEKIKPVSVDEAPPQTPPDLPDSGGNSPPMMTPDALMRRISYFATHDQKPKFSTPSFMKDLKE
jgi:hypothetical protein